MKNRNLTTRIVKKYLADIFGKNPTIKIFYAMDKDKLSILDSSMKTLVIVPKESILR